MPPMSRHEKGKINAKMAGVQKLKLRNPMERGKRALARAEVKPKGAGFRVKFSWRF